MNEEVPDQKASIEPGSILVPENSLPSVPDHQLQHRIAAIGLGSINFDRQADYSNGRCVVHKTICERARAPEPIQNLELILVPRSWGSVL